MAEGRNQTKKSTAAREQYLPMFGPDNLRVIHTADWHLGKRLCEQSREDEHALFLDWLVEKIIQLRIDLLIVAGDTFDSANPPHSSASLLYQFLTRLHQDSKCEVAIIGGNHDSARQLQSVAPLLKTHRVHVVGMLPEDVGDCLIEIGNPPKAIVAAVPFLRDRDVRVSQPGESILDIQNKLLEGIQSIYTQIANATANHDISNIPVIATGHLTTLGSSSSDSELAIHVGGLGAFPSSSFPGLFSYVALGHLHRPQAADVRGRIRYSGSPIPLSFSESNDEKVVHFLEFEGKDLISQTPLVVPQHRGLIRLSCDAKEVEEYLTAMAWPSFSLGCLVELTLANASARSLPMELIRAAIKDPKIQILQIRTADQTELQPLQREGLDVEEAIRFLRAEPKEVFKQRLDQTRLDAELRDKVILEFDLLIEEHFTANQDLP